MPADASRRSLVAAPDRMTPRTAYLYVVCLVMLLVGVYAVVQLVRGGIALAYPEEITAHAWTPSEEAIVVEGVDERFLSPEQRAEWDSQRRDDVISTVTAGATLLLAGGLFVVHWRRVQQDRSMPAAAPEVPAA